jgi:predicted nucleic acid-binding protein
MIIVADASPMNYLVLIAEIGILPIMYGRVVIPHTVREELMRAAAPQMFELGSVTRQCGSRFGGHSLYRTRR